MPSVQDVFPDDALSQDAAMLLCAMHDLSLLEHPACGDESWLPEYYPGWVEEFTEWLEEDIRPGGQTRENEILTILTGILGSYYMDKCSTEFVMHEHSTLKSGRGDQAKVDRVHECCLGFSPERFSDGKHAPHLMRAAFEILRVDRRRFFKKGQRYASKWTPDDGYFEPCPGPSSPSLSDDSDEDDNAREVEIEDAAESSEADESSSQTSTSHSDDSER